MAEGRTDFETDPDGWYVEPTSSTEFLLARERFVGPVWDPCCGQGNIVTTMRAAGVEAYGTDIKRRVDDPAEPDWWGGVSDFLADRWSHEGSMQNVVMNPPYGRALLAEAFIRKALAMPIAKVAAFANSKFLFGSGRAAGLYAEHRPSRVYPISPRPSCPPGEFLRRGGKASGGVENFVWIVWDLTAPPGASAIRW